MRGPAHPRLYNDSSEENDSDEDSPRHSSNVDQYIHDMENFQKRHALGTSPLFNLFFHETSTLISNVS